ncbi:hypothetical protein BGZ47_003025, partial [Haplosporangium gracile]
MSPSQDAMMELERTLDTTKVFDLFTMQPKACALSLGSVERSVIIRGDYCFTVATDANAEDRFEDGHLLLLSDLLLICRTKTQDEISRNVDGNVSTHWLLFPPLAVRHVIAADATQADQVPVIELTIVNRVKTRIWILEDRLKTAWIHEINSAQQFDSSKAAQQQQQQQQQGGQLNRNFTQSRPMRPMGPGSPLSLTFQGGPPPQHFNNGPLSPPMQGRPTGPLSPTFQGHPGGPGSPMLRPRPSMGGRPPMGGPMGGPMGSPMVGPMHPPGFRPQMAPGRPGMLQHYGGGSMHGRPRPMQRGMSMRRANTMGGPRGRILQKGDVAAPKELIYKSKPCDVFQWRDDMWDPLVEDDDCYVELRLTMSNRLVMAVITADQGQLVLNAWIVESTTFRRASETDVSVSMDMGASVQWFLVALNSGREAEEFCMSFQRTKDRAMYDPNLQKSSSSPVLSRGDSLASTVTQQSAREKPVKQTLNTMYPPSECKLLLQAGDHGQWISLGAARVEIKMEKPSGHVRLFVGLISGNKRVLDSVIVQCDCLELVGPKKLAITLQNPQEKMSIIYMLQFKDEAITTKIFEGLSLNENDLPADGNILVPDRSGLVRHAANATTASKSKMNGVARAAAEETDIMNICVGVAGNPTRTQIFKDRTTCDINVQQVHGPHTDCPWFKEACDGNVYSKNMQVHVYEAFEPHRIMLAPGYDGTKHGWTYKWSIAYMSHFFALSSKGYKLIEERHKPHLVKRADITRPNRSEKNALQALIDCWTYNSLGAEGIKSYYHIKTA